jgi:hypothetical protein
MSIEINIGGEIHHLRNNFNNYQRAVFKDNGAWKADEMTLTILNRDDEVIYINGITTYRVIDSIIEGSSVRNLKAMQKAIEQALSEAGL